MGAAGTGSGAATTKSAEISNDAARRETRTAKAIAKVIRRRPITDAVCSGRLMRACWAGCLRASLLAFY